jgi:uncharacterized protein YacL
MEKLYYLAAAGGSGGLNIPGTGYGTNMTADTIVTTVINTLIWFVGIIAVVFIIFGGIKYATSGGDEKKVASAKNTILYAVIGLVVALLAAVIVNVVLKQLGIV